MKTLMTRRFFLLVLSVLWAAASCTRPYNDTYEHLRVDRTELKLPAAEGTIAIMVYYSGSWNAALGEGCDWAGLDASSGSGITALHLHYQENILTARESSLTLSNDKDEFVTITITQNAGN